MSVFGWEIPPKTGLYSPISRQKIAMSFLVDLPTFKTPFCILWSAFTALSSTRVFQRSEQSIWDRICESAKWIRRICVTCHQMKIHSWKNFAYLKRHLHTEMLSKKKCSKLSRKIIRKRFRSLKGIPALTLKIIGLRKISKKESNSKINLVTIKMGTVKKWTSNLQSSTCYTWRDKIWRRCLRMKSQLGSSKIRWMTLIWVNLRKPKSTKS